jgi:hypothetical protein
MFIDFLFIYFLFIYSHVHTLFGSFLHHALLPPSPTLSLLSPSVSGRSLSALILNSVFSKTEAKETTPSQTKSAYFSDHSLPD